MTFCEQLEKLGACEEAIEWVGNKSLEEAWEQCDRYDWLAWAALIITGWYA